MPPKDSVYRSPGSLANDLLKQIEDLQKTSDTPVMHDYASLNLHDFIYKVSGIPIRGYHTDLTMEAGSKDAPYAPVHHQIIQKLENPELRRLLFLVARGHGKSTILSEYYPAWEIVRDPSVRILEISFSKDVATASINNSSDYLEDLGVVFTKNDEEIKFVARPKKGVRKRDPTIMSASTDSKLHGRHADIIILDDTCVLENCFDDVTEVLTDDGWKYFKDVSMADSFYTLNIQTDNIEIQRSSKIIQQKYSGDMVSIESGGISLMVTPNHNLLIKREHHGHWYDDKYVLSPAENEYAKTGRKFKKNGTWHCSDVVNQVIPSISNNWVANNVPRSYYKPEISIPMKSWLPFFGIYLAEGSTGSIHGRNRTKRKKNMVFISQKNHTNKMRDIIKKLSFRFREDVRSDGVTQFTIFSTQLAEYLSMFGHSHEKFIPKEIKMLPSKKLEILLRAMTLGDGSISEEGYWRYGTRSKILADDVQEVALKIGRAASIYTYIDHTGVPMYNIYIYKKDHCEPVLRSKRYWSKKSYNGYIYCATVPNHTLYIRRNGKAVWAGNCWTEIQRSKFEEWFSALVSQVLEAHGRLIVTGVRWRQADFHGVLADPLKHPEFGITVPPLCNTDINDGKLIAPACTKDFKNIIWPERWGEKLLRDKLSEIGPIFFASQLLLDPSSMEAGTFKLDWIFGPDSSEYQSNPIQSMPQIKFRCMGVDPSLGVGMDMFGACVGGVTLSNEFLTLAFIQENIPTGQQGYRTIELAKEYNVGSIGVEEVQYQIALKNAIEEKIKDERLMIDVKGFSGPKKKEFRLAELGTPLFNGSIRFPKENKPWKRAFITEFVSFPSGENSYDMLDSLYYAYKVSGSVSMAPGYDDWEPNIIPARVVERSGLRRRVV